MADIILLVAQVSATLTTLMGIVSIVIMFNIAKNLVKDSYQSLILKSAFFFLIALISVTAMTIYHYMEGRGEPELWDSLWYGFMFIALIFSFYVSLSLAFFGKKFEKMKIGKTKRK